MIFVSTGVDHFIKVPCVCEGEGCDISLGHFQSIRFRFFYFSALQTEGWPEASFRWLTLGIDASCRIITSETLLVQQSREVPFYTTLVPARNVSHPLFLALFYHCSCELYTSFFLYICTVEHCARLWSSSVHLYCKPWHQPCLSRGL